MTKYDPAKNDNTITYSRIAENLRKHPQRSMLEELVEGIHSMLSYIEEERSFYPMVQARSIQKITDARKQDVLREQQSILGAQYKITRAYTVGVTFTIEDCPRVAFYDCIYYKLGEQHGITFLPHEGIADIIGKEE